MVDHHFANASQGAIGLVSAVVKPPASELEHHNMPASAVPSDPDTIAGQQPGWMDQPFSREPGV